MLQTLFEQYDHHGRRVWVRPELKGQHRKYCLCFSCKNLNIEDRSKNCFIANALFDNCVKLDVVTPVFECPEFDAKDNVEPLIPNNITLTAVHSIDEKDIKCLS